MTATPETDVPYCEEHDAWHADGICPPALNTDEAIAVLREKLGRDPRTDREILLNIESMMTQIRDLVAAVAEESGPVIQQIAGHAMFRMFFGKVKTGD